MGCMENLLPHKSEAAGIGALRACGMSVPAYGWNMKYLWNIYGIYSDLNWTQS